eukprot:GEMP01153212.1.p1 GENE.GEMP01153212.1~~GEMP01153212.1.p1  ORF type:complete len:120 (-),score=4.88 GEMP01153212.1:6-365(-)
MNQVYFTFGNTRYTHTHKHGHHQPLGAQICGIVHKHTAQYKRTTKKKQMPPRSKYINSVLKMRTASHSPHALNSPYFTLRVRYPFRRYEFHASPPHAPDSALTTKDPLLPLQIHAFPAP